ncbi:hypothetical protein HDU93_005150 [Gonapodya sp. JEL0774]|nr:hypothetical protein HDU93_005150 [Gonapodya sp. JEL0774]
MPIEDILSKFKDPPEKSTISELEFVVVRELKYDLKVRHPFGACHGIFLEMQDFLSPSTRNDESTAAAGESPMPTTPASVSGNGEDNAPTDRLNTSLSQESIGVSELRIESLDQPQHPQTSVANGKTPAVSQSFPSNSPPAAPSAILTYSNSSRDPQHSQAAPLDRLKASYTRAQALVERFMLTDMPLVYWPSQIAMACWQEATKESRMEAEFASFLDSRIRSNPAVPRETSDELLTTISTILKHLPPPVDRKSVDKKSSEEDKRLRVKRQACMNPAMDPSSLVALKKREEEKEVNRERKRRRKEALSQSQGGMSDHQVFDSQASLGESQSQQS